MKTHFFSAVLLTSLVAGLSAGAVEYRFANGADGWVAASSGTLSTSPGTITFTYTDPSPNSFDPILAGPGSMHIDAARDHWLVLELDLSAAPGAGPQLFQIFFDDGAGDGHAGYNEPDSRQFTVTPNIGMQRVVFDMLPIQSERDAWSGVVSNFRIDPGTSLTDLVGYSCTFDRIGMTSDTDLDGIRDDAEYLYWGNLDTADATTDYDGDGLLDSLEIALGLNPLVNEGAELPVSSPWGQVFLLGMIVLAGVAMAKRVMRRA